MAAESGHRRLRDSDIRSSLVRHLRNVHQSEPDTVIRHELGICAGSRRIDLAVLNGEIVGYEIKSDEDTLARLMGQVHAYGRVLDRATLVTTARHVDKAMSQLPEWWGVVIVACQDFGGVGISWIRDPQYNANLDPFALAQLLWRDEALNQLRSLGLGKGLSRKARHYVWIELAKALSVPELRAVVREQVKTRIKENREWPVGRPHERDGVTSHMPATQ